MAEIAQYLHLPQEIFVIRAQEAAMRDELRALDKKAKERRSLFDGK